MSDLCTFCEQTKETIKHLFWECEHVTNIWKALQKWLSRTIINTVTITYENMSLANYEGIEDKLVNIIIIIIFKQYIYASISKKTPPNFIGALSKVRKCVKLKTTLQQKITHSISTSENGNCFINIKVLYM